MPRYGHGDDWTELCEARIRCKAIASNPNLPWIERERAMELMVARSLEEYEQIRMNYSEMVLAVMDYTSYITKKCAGPCGERIEVWKLDQHGLCDSCQRQQDQQEQDEIESEEIDD